MQGYTSCSKSGNVSHLSERLRVKSSPPRLPRAGPRERKGAPGSELRLGDAGAPDTQPCLPQKPWDGGSGKDSWLSLEEEQEWGTWGQGHVCKGGLEMGKHSDESPLWGRRQGGLQGGLRRQATSHRNLSSVRSYNSHERVFSRGLYSAFCLSA